jgi:hypothetical protein
MSTSITNKSEEQEVKNRHERRVDKWKEEHMASIDRKHNAYLHAHREGRQRFIGMLQRGERAHARVLSRRKIARTPAMYANTNGLTA